MENSQVPVPPAVKHPDVIPTGYPELGKEPFNADESEIREAWKERMPDEWVASPPSNEKAVEEYFDRVFGEQFTLYRQIWLKHPSYPKGLRIDRVGVSKSGSPAGIFGFELKSLAAAATDFTDFSNSIGQAIDYRESRINSDLFPDDWFNRDFRFVFVFPCAYSIYEKDNKHTTIASGERYRDIWAQGELKLAGKYGVGAIQYVREQQDWVFLLGGHPAYWLKTGPTHLGIKHAVGKRMGSGR